ncbi:RNA polymerase sigma factor [Planctomycetaceae bacterium SH139]
MSAEPTSETTAPDTLSEPPAGRNGSVTGSPIVSATGGVNNSGPDADSTDLSWALQHADWLGRLIANRIRPLDCEEEVLQEVWLAASRSPSVPECPTEQTPWLARVAIRQCALALRSWLRRQKRESTYASQMGQQVERAQADPLFSLLVDEKRQLVREQFQHLPAEQRQLLEMKYVNGWTYRKISQSLGMNLTAVEYQLTKARKALRARLVQVGVEEGNGHARK